jgi:hypothetical protein
MLRAGAFFSSLAPASAAAAMACGVAIPAAISVADNRTSLLFIVLSFAACAAVIAVAAGIAAIMNHRIARSDYAGGNGRLHVAARAIGRWSRMSAAKSGSCLSA